MQRAFVRTLLVTFVVFATVFTAEFVLEWNRLGRPLGEALSWAGSNNGKLVDVLSPMARAYNNILAMLLATIGLAIPLTANMHTPKLISMFLRDRTNQVVLFVMALGSANVLFVDYLIGPGFAPMWAFRAAVLLVLCGWALLIPYFFYVVRFLDPSEIVIRLRDQAKRDLDRALLPGADLEAFQDRMHDSLMQIGTLIVKSLDRSDRGVAIEGVWALKQILDHYGNVKPHLPDAAFRVDRHDFVGLSQEAIEIVNESATWLERKTLMQLEVAFRNALSKASDTVASMSDAVRVIAEAAHRRDDRKALALSLYTLNAFIRDAISTRHVHAIYDVFYQYRLLARSLAEEPDVLRDLARWFAIYAEAARDAGMQFAHDLAAFDVGSIARRAYEADNRAKKDLLDAALSFRHENGGEPRRRVVKAKLMLGGFFVEHGLLEEAARVRADLKGVPTTVLRAAEQDLLAAERTHYELSDRQVNIEWLEPQRREPVRKFVAGFLEVA